MKAFVTFQALFVLSALIHNTDAELSLRVISPLGESTINDINVPKDCECNAKATFVCEVKPYINSVTWQINGRPYAACILKKCFTYPPFPENHIFTMDLAREVFNITVNPVTSATHDNVYKCDDGITGRSVEARVKVFPNNETLDIDESAKDRITVTTGCVYSNGKDDLTFEWYITEDNTSLGGEPLTTKSQSTINFTCTEALSCTVKETSHFNNTVVFDVFDDGEGYYIYVIIKHKDAPNRPSTVQRTKKRFKVKNIDCCHYYIIIIIVVALRITVVQTLVSGYMYYRTFLKDGHKHSIDGCTWMRFVVGIPLFGFIILKKATCGGVKKVYSSAEVNHSVSHGIIVCSLGASIIDPALGICFTSIKFARSNKVTISCCWIICMLLATVCWISIEVVMLIQCYVLRWNWKCYFLLMTLYLVILWIYLTFVVILLVDKLSKKEVVSELCNECGNCARFQCTVCTELMCEECLWSHKHSKNQREKDIEFVCQQCRLLPVNSYCMACKKYFCVKSSCMKLHRKCEQCIPRHQQHNEDREREFCCDSCKESENYNSAAHAFCLTCRVYLCTSCLKEKHETCTLLWIQKRTGKRVERLCCEEIYDHKELPLEGVCLTCERFICKRCVKNPKYHRTHRVASHQQEHNFPRASSRFLCRGCERLPVECYNLNNDEFLCAKCFEKDHKSSPSERKEIYLNSNILLLKHQIRTKISSCQIHTVLGDASPSHVEVYCLECKIYMCRICFFRHRRISEFWIKSQKGNMFYCNICKKDEHVYPVECCNIETGEYMCANCYECIEHNGKRKYAEGQSKDVRKMTSNFTKMASPCQIHKFPFNEHEKEVPGCVYCLVCKLYLCKHCFVLHRRLKYVWQKELQHGAQAPSEASTDVISKNNVIHVAKHSGDQVSKTKIGLMLWWHFPLVGIGIAVLPLCCQYVWDYIVAHRQVVPATNSAVLTTPGQENASKMSVSYPKSYLATDTI